MHVRAGCAVPLAAALCLCVVAAATAGSPSFSGTCDFHGDASFGGSGVTTKSEHNTFDPGFTQSCTPKGGGKQSATVTSTATHRKHRR